MPIQSDGFTKDPSGSGGGGSAPAGTGFVRVTSGVYDTPAALGATEIQNALDAGSGTASQVVRGDGTISALVPGDIPLAYLLSATLASNQTPASGSFANNLILFATLGTNQGTSWTYSAGTFTCAANAGRWLIIATVDDTGSNVAYALLLQNGSATKFRSLTTAASTNRTCQVVGVLDFALNDTFAVSYNANTGGTSSLSTANCALQAIYLGRAS